MNGYDLVKLVHILAAIGLFTGAGVAFVAMLRMRSAANVQLLREGALIASTSARGLPATIVFLFLPGVYMVIDRWGWDTPWMLVALALYLIMLPLALSFNLPRLLAIHRAARGAPDGPVPPDLARRVHDPRLWTSVQTMTALDLSIVVLMVTKPALGASITIAAVFGLIGLASCVPYWRDRPNPPAPFPVGKGETSGRRHTVGSPPL